MINDIPWQKIVDIACNAPSGGNSQPWSIVKDNDSLVIRTDLPQSFYVQSYDRIGAYISIGALAYNVETVARGLGYSSSISIMEADQPFLKVNITDFNPSNLSQTAIDSVINRTTNRKPSVGKLPEDVITRLGLFLQEHFAANGLPSFTLKFTRDPDVIKSLSYVIAESEILRFTHEITFKKVFVSELKCKENDSHYKIALNTLELPWVLEKFMCSIIKIPALRHLLLKKIVALTVQDQFSQSSDIGCIFGDKKISPVDLIQLGRAIEALWLKLTEYGYYMHPWTSFTFYGLEKSMGYDPTFSELEQESVEQMMNTVSKIYNEPDRIPLFLFRTLDAPKPEFHSGKKNILITGGS